MLKKMDFKKIKSSPITEKILFAVLLVFGAYFTDLALDETLWKRPTLHVFIFICAVCFDACLFRLLHKMLKRKAIPVLKDKVKKAFSALYKRIAKATKKFSGRSGNGKIFVDGKDERSFAVESRDRKQAKRKKKLPALPKNADERQKARHAYTVLVFKKEKDIPSVLTPSEVALRIDEKGENADIFHNYNFARYSKEEKEIRQ
jgi:hypothetical protein